MGEHKNREESEAHREHKAVIKNEVRLYHAICPDCGKAYYAGGETNTLVAEKVEPSKNILKENEDHGINFDTHI